MELQLIHGYRDDSALRQSFNRLAEETFGLNFENWYQNGFWGGCYDPHSLLLEGRIVSNVSVNRISGLLDGQERHYIQLGTVMTEKGLRNKGCCRRLIEAVLSGFSSYDGIFLYANDSVLDFYPKFGFQPVKERRWRADLQGNDAASVRNVAMETPADWRRFLEEKNCLRSLGLLQLNTDGLLMFYLSQFMKDFLFFSAEFNAYIVAEADGSTLRVYDIYSDGRTGPLEICRAFGPWVRQVDFAFTPADRRELTAYAHREEDTTLFLLGEPVTGDLQLLGGFPQLAHA